MADSKALEEAFREAAEDAKLREHKKALREAEIRRLRMEGTNPFKGQQMAWMERLGVGANERVTAYVLDMKTLSYGKKAVDIEKEHKLDRVIVRFYDGDKPLPKWAVWTFEAAAKEELYQRARREETKLHKRLDKVISVVERLEKELI